MKRVRTFIQYGLMAAIAAHLLGCSATKKGKIPGTKEIELPCSEEAKPDKQYYRAWGDKESLSSRLAYDHALAIAQQRVSQLISTDIEGKFKDYSKSMGDAFNEAVGTYFQQGAKGRIKASLRNTEIFCHKTYQKKEGGYLVYIAIQLNKDEINQSLNQVMLDAAKQKNIRHDSEKFFETFNN